MIIFDKKYQKKIIPAEIRLFNKLLMIDFQSLNITEYNIRKWAHKYADLKNVLNLYGNLIGLSCFNRSIPLENIVLVDYGGGCGLLSFLAKEIGIGTVIYIDIYEGSCNDVRIFSEKIQLPLDHIICGDVADLLQYVQKNTIAVDSIVSYDVLEHIYNVEDHFMQLSSLSNSQFRIIYGSGANIKNSKIRNQLTKTHLQFEYESRENKFGQKETDCMESFFQIRKKIISQYAPDLNNEHIEQLSHATRGLIKEDIERSVDEYLKKGKLSYIMDHPTNTCDPYSGSWCEQLIDFDWLQQMLVKYNYKVKIIPGFFPTSNKSIKSMFKYRFLNLLLDLFPKQGLYIASYYILFAETEIVSEQGNFPFIIKQ